MQTPQRKAGAVEEEEVLVAERPPGGGGGNRFDAAPTSPTATCPPLVNPVEDKDRAALLVEVVPTPG